MRREQLLKATEALHEEFVQVTREEGVREGVRHGVERGLAPTAHLFARKMGRPLSGRERAIIAERLNSLGPERLGDVALDLDGPALAAWLANPRAR